MLASMAIENTSARQGGSTFQAKVFSTWKIAFAVAVMRPASVPGWRSAKYAIEWPVRWRNRSRRMSPVTATKQCVDTQPPSRQNRLSAVIRPASRTKAIWSPPTSRAESTSTRFLIAYCDSVAAATAATTESAMTRWPSAWRRT